MHPIPCAHCGTNFMLHTLDPEAPHLCNSCLIKEEKRNPTKGKQMDTIGIVINCPRKDQNEIEEICLAQGKDFTRYFLELHYASQAAVELMNEATNQKPEIQEFSEKPKQVQVGKAKKK